MREGHSVSFQHVSYGTPDEPLIFKDTDFDIPLQQWTVILGRTGIGKSTLLQLLAKLITPHSGTVHAPRCGYLTQKTSALPWLNMLDNLLLPAKLRGVPPERERAEAILQRLKLWDHRHKFPREWSGGMLQRIMIGRLLLEEAPLVLLDEPFGALDALTRYDIHEVLWEALQHKTVVLVTHDVWEALRLGHHVWTLSGNPIHIKKHTLPSAPLRSPTHPAVLALHHELMETLS